MNQNHIGELIFYDEQEPITIPLTKTQSHAILKILGLSLNYSYL